MKSFTERAREFIAKTPEIAMNKQEEYWVISFAKWLDSRYQEGVKAEREKNEAGMYHSQGKSCCYLNPCGCVCHDNPSAPPVR
jgi:hypothetical protein